MPRPPLDGQVRAAILASLRAARDEPDPARRPSRNEVARRHGVAASTIGRIAGQNGLTGVFDRTITAKAARARQFDVAAARTALIERLYGMAGRLLDRVEEPHTIVLPGPGGYELATTPLPPLRDAQAGMSAAAIAIDKAARLEDRQGDGRADQARSLLGSLLEGLQRAHGDSPDGSG